MRQPKFFYGPLLGFLMGLAFSKASGKYQDFDASAPWYVSERPPNYNDEEYLSQWHPLKDPYYTVTTHLPHFQDAAFSSVSGFGDETAAASNVNVHRRKPYKNNKRRRNNNNRPKRRRTTTTTTTESYYYEDYYSEEFDDYYNEEVTSRKPSIKKRKRTTTSAYDDYQDYSVESTTKSKKRKKPTFNSASVEIDDVETTTKKLLPQRETTTTTTMVETTTEMTTNTTTFVGYNGTSLHDNITFTYGPPTNNDSNFGPGYTNYGPPVAKLDYPPFWYSSFKSRNDIVKRVQDIVSEDDFLGLGDLQH